jgi:hypothetical protein
VAQQVAVGVEFHDGGRGLAALVFGWVFLEAFLVVEQRGRAMDDPDVGSSGDTAIPATWPRIQPSGSGFGQNGSGWNAGGLSAFAVCCAAATFGVSAAASANDTIASMRRIVNPPFCALRPSAVGNHSTPLE